jgi:hypothetical protein
MVKEIQEQYFPVKQPIMITKYKSYDRIFDTRKKAEVYDLKYQKFEDISSRTINDYVLIMSEEEWDICKSCGKWWHRSDQILIFPCFVYCANDNEIYPSGQTINKIYEYIQDQVKLCKELARILGVEL